MSVVVLPPIVLLWPVALTLPLVVAEL